MRTRVNTLYSIMNLYLYLYFYLLLACLLAFFLSSFAHILKKYTVPIFIIYRPDFLLYPSLSGAPPAPLRRFPGGPIPG